MGDSNGMSDAFRWEDLMVIIDLPSYFCSGISGSA